MRTILIDIGNTCSKYAIVNDESLRVSDAGIAISPMISMSNKVLSQPDAEHFSNDRFDLFSEDVAKWLICSVNAEALEAMLAKIKSIRPDDSICVVKSKDMPVTLDVAEPDRVGVDRVCAAVAARDLCDELFPSGRDAIVIDAGTAVTIDLIDKDRVFRGGVIFPGMSLSFKSLHTNTSLLPEIGYESLKELGESVIGKSTEEAIRNGVMFSQVGAITSIVERIRELRDGPVEVYITGGESQPALSQMPQCRYVEDLVLRGMLPLISESQ